MKKLFLFLLLALLAFPAAMAEDAPTEYVDVTVVIGAPSIDAGVNIRQLPDADSAKVASMSPGEKCTVTGRANGWYAVEFDGKTGYVREDLLKVKETTVQVEKIVEDPLLASCEGFQMPFMEDPGDKLKVVGTVSSNIPMAEVKITVFDLRQLADEAVVSQKFSREADVREFDLSAFSGASALRKLSSGEKKAVVSVVSANEEQTVAEQLVYISGKCADPVSMTAECKIAVSRGSASSFLDDSYKTSWSPRSAEDTVKIRIPSEKTAAGLYMEWDKAPSRIEITLYDNTGAVIRTVQESNPSGKWNLYYPLEEAVSGLTIRSADTDNGLNKLRIYEKGKIPQAVQQWQDTPEKIDLMMILPHMNDETLYFSGVLSQLSAQGKNVLVVYMAGDSRNKHAEALDCLWTHGVRIHPVFVGFADYKTATYSQAERLWGSENTYKAMVGLIRKYKPDVVLTQDWNGEYGHNQHIMTARYCVKSVELAADASAFPAIAEAYGVWDVPKLYLHLWDEENRLELGFDQKLDALGGLSPMQVAFIAMDKHTSQLHNPTYSLLVDGRDYDCTCFGLYRSTVGPDVEKNSFFEHLE